MLHTSPNVHPQIVAESMVATAFLDQPNWHTLGDTSPLGGFRDLQTFKVWGDLEDGSLIYRTAEVLETSVYTHSCYRVMYQLIPSPSAAMPGTHQMTLLVFSND